jgi:hypothetical protein
MRRCPVLLLLLCVGLLSGCSNPWFPYPAPEPYVDPYPYSFTDASKPLYPLGLYGAQRFLSDVRARWVYQENVGCQYPADSFLCMSGDCDDFATMVAYYFQEYWAYDTFIVMFNVVGRGLHACAYVDSTRSVTFVSDCAEQASLTMNGVRYDPVDWERCPMGSWVSSGTILCYEWYVFAGNPTLGED